MHVRACVRVCTWCVCLCVRVCVCAYSYDLDQPLVRRVTIRLQTFTHTHTHTHMHARTRTRHDKVLASAHKAGKAPATLPPAPTLKSIRLGFVFALMGVCFVCVRVCLNVSGLGGQHQHSRPRRPSPVYYVWERGRRGKGVGQYTQRTHKYSAQTCTAHA